MTTSENTSGGGIEQLDIATRWETCALDIHLEGPSAASSHTELQRMTDEKWELVTVVPVRTESTSIRPGDFHHADRDFRLKSHTEVTILRYFFKRGTVCTKWIPAELTAKAQSALNTDQNTGYVPGPPDRTIPLTDLDFKRGITLYDAYRSRFEGYCATSGWFDLGLTERKAWAYLSRIVYFRA